MVALNELGAHSGGISDKNETVIYNAIRSHVAGGYSMPADVAQYAYSQGKRTTYMIEDRARIDAVKATFSGSAHFRMSFFDWWAWGRLWQHWWTPEKRTLLAKDVGDDRRALLVYLNSGGGLHYLLARSGQGGGAGPYVMMDPALGANSGCSLADMTGNALRTTDGIRICTYKYIGIAIVIR
jgi:hypothetical protein